LIIGDLKTNLIKIMEDFKMGFRIQNNIAAMNAQRNLGINDSAMSKSLERLSSGFRINKASDDAAGLSISTQLSADIASLTAAGKNAEQANSSLQTAEGSMDQISNMLTRIKELATQAASANSEGNRDKIEAESAKLLTEIDRIAGNMTTGTATYQVGSANNDDSKIAVTITTVDTAALNIDDLSLGSVASAQAALGAVNTAIGTLSAARGQIGAAQSRLGYALANLNTTVENTQAAESVIKDVDMANEITAFSKNQILVQAGTAMLAQANQAPQNVLSLLK
jgi:flagellin